MVDVIGWLLVFSTTAEVLLTNPVVINDEITFNPGEGDMLAPEIELIDVFGGGINVFVSVTGPELAGNENDIL